MEKGILTKLRICLAGCLVMAMAWTAILSCRKPYSPKVTTASTGILVVEGVINTGADSTIIKLSRTVPLDNKTSLKTETKATVTIEDDQNKSYALTEIKSGTYATPSPSLSSARKYRLRIKTTDGQTYLSDLAQPKAAPPIDSVGFVPSGDQDSDHLTIYANAHDNTANTRYYRWDFEETWRFHAKYYSYYESNGKAMIDRPAGDQIFYCFTGDLSANIVVGSTVKLSQDVIYQQPITTIPATSEKIGVRYSILLKQYALTQEAYNFWLNIKKNTEQLGSIFDVQPSEIAGNIHCISNTSLPVIGYISVGTVQTKRIFIDHSQLPNWHTTYPYDCSSIDTMYYSDPKLHQDQVTPYLIRLPSDSRALEPIRDNNDNIIAFTAASKTCADCTIRGYTQQPTFWK